MKLGSDHHNYHKEVNQIPLCINHLQHNGNIDNMINSQMNCEDIAEKWKIINDSVQPTVRRLVTLDDVKEQQQQAVLVWLDICGVSKNNDGDFIPSKIREDNISFIVRA
jgi:hypothetical protein